MNSVLFYPLDEEGIRLYATEFHCSLTIKSPLNVGAILTITLENDSENFVLATNQNCSIEGIHMGVSAENIECA